MLRTPLCQLLEIDYPIIQAGMTAGTSAALCAAVCEAGALGSLSASLRTPGELDREIAKTRDLTGRPFAVNHLVPMLNEASFALSLQASPRVVTFALGQPGDLVKRAHDAGCLVMQQVNTVEQAEQAAEAGADIIIAQGGESGGFGGFVATMTLVPQIVDAVGAIPVVAAGSVFDGRGLAAALVLGAQGVNVGTRFLACRESPASDAWQRGILAARSEDAEKRDFLSAMVPDIPSAYHVTPRSLSSAFIERWRKRSETASANVEEMLAEVMQAADQGRIADAVPFAGQTAGAIRETLSAADIVRGMVAEAEDALGRANALLT
jgi:enoyl-[acyl-carrier protein] reductase II